VIGLDTNVLARYFVAENDADAATERQRRAAPDLIESGQPDALHHASCRSCASMASFDDRGFGRRIRQLNLAPRLFVPAAA
jgi:hypothetical protein